MLILLGSDTGVMDHILMHGEVVISEGIFSTDSENLLSKRKSKEPSVITRKIDNNPSTC